MAFRSTLAFMILVFLPVLATPQKTAKQKSDTVQRNNPALDIVTKVPFNGQYYFIRIAPVDSGNPDNMPIATPGQRSRPFIWYDSLQRLLPDSILKQLEKLKPKP